MKHQSSWRSIVQPSSSRALFLVFSFSVPRVLLQVKLFNTGRITSSDPRIGHGAPPRSCSWKPIPGTIRTPVLLDPSSLYYPYSETRHQPRLAWRAPVARKRWIGGWEAVALARRLLVLCSSRCERVVVVGRASFQRGRGVRARAGAGRAGPKRPWDSARTAYLPK